jgi:hypothetical protein
MDGWLVAGLVLAGIGFGMGIAGAWYAQRLFEVQRNSAKRIGQMQQEKLAMEKMIRQAEIREQIYGDIPLERVTPMFEIPNPADLPGFWRGPNDAE